MSNYLPKYSLKQATIKVGYPNGFERYDPRLGRNVHVKPFTRTQMVRDYTYSTKILEHQRAESDWSHQSGEYPNIIGLNDEEIQEYIKNTKEDKEVVREYIKHIKCFDKDDIREVSKKAYGKFKDTMKKKYYHIEPFPDAKDPYNPENTIYITSPRGGFHILADFGYANKLDKKCFPYDIERYDPNMTLKSDALPYDANIYDVNDIVFIDDIYMSGEQCNRAIDVLKNKITELNLPKKQEPRLHYMAMVGNKHKVSDYDISKWDSFTVGEEFNFRRSGMEFEGVSAVVFPFSIPDGTRHYTARRLYSNKKRFAHRKY